MRVLNPAFDVTPAHLVTAIVTERGIVKPSKLKKGLKKATFRMKLLELSPDAKKFRLFITNILSGMT